MVIIREVKVEKVDKETGYVVKRVITSDKEFLARQMPVTNSLYLCEKAREKFKKSVLGSPIQIHHIHKIKLIKNWDYSKLQEQSDHAKKNRRIFFPYQQNTIKDLATLDWKKSEKDFDEILSYKTDYVPINIPENVNLEQIKEFIKLNNAKLKEHQDLFLVISADHDVLFFSKIIKNYIGKMAVIGIRFMSPESHANAKSNLNELWHINASVPEGNPTSMFISFGNEKHYKESKVSGSFVTSKYGLDVPSQRQMATEQIKGMIAEKEDLGPEEDFIYYPDEGGFNKSEEQSFHGINATQKLYSTVSLEEGLNRYQALHWSNFHGQKEDFDLLNQAILNKKVKELVSSKSRWKEYYASVSIETS